MAAADSDAVQVALGPRSEGGRSLSRIQQQIWSSQRLHRTKPLANMAKTHRIRGPLDPELLLHSFEQVVVESDALRSVIVDHAGTEPELRILAHPPASTEVGELPEGDLDDWIAERIATPVDAVRCAYDSVLLRHGDDDWTWWLDLHHLVTDAWGSSEIYRATEARYRQRLEAAADEAPLPSYYDYVDELDARFEEGRDRRLARWSDLALDETPIAPSGPRGATTTSVDRLPVSITPTIESALDGVYRTLSRELSLIGVFAGALAVVLHRLDGRERLTFGVPLHNRSGPLAQRVVGPLMELYPLTVEMSGDESFADLFARVQRSLLDTMRHARPGESPDLGLDAVVNVLTSRFGDFAGMPTETGWNRSGHVDPAHPIRLHLYDYGDGLRGEVDLNRGLSVDGAHVSLARHLEAAVRVATTDPAATIGSVSLADADDLERVARLNPERSRPAPTKPVHELVRARLRAAPDAVTAECGGRELTAAELDARADAVAGWLAERGVGLGSRVGIRMARSLEVLEAVHGVLRAGAAFVMLDPSDPAARHDAIAADSQLSLVLDELPDELPDVNTGAPAPGPIVGPDDLAYVLYTSGSTGEPKGVPIPHRGLTDYLDFAVDAYVDEDAPPVMPLHSALVFDLTITSLFLPQLTGGRTVVLPGEPLEALSAIGRDERLNTLKATPGQLELLSRMIEGPLPLRSVIVGGEAFRRPVAAAFVEHCAPGVRVYNEYGPTEAVVGCMLHEWDPGVDVGPDVPIGRACPGAEVHVLDGFRRPTPPGSWGELYVTRPGMAAGYLDLPESTAERFVTVPEVSGRTLYRTGDRVRLENDVLVYGGRMDDQLKVGGVRLEPGEIEAALAAHPDVTNAVVRTWTPTQRSVGLRRCTRCGLGTEVPGVVIDESGVCSTCTRFDDVAPATREWFRDETDLDAERRRARERSTGEYDCLHLLSGGKDSTYALYQLVERGWRVHALTLDNGFVSEGAKDNVRRSIADLGITHEFVTTGAMNEIFRDSLDRYANVCNGCYKTIYTLAVARAHELGIPVIVTGLSRGQFFETRLVPHQFDDGRFDPAAIDRTVLQARRTYHHTGDAVTELLTQQEIFERTDIDVLAEIEFVDFYRYVDVSLTDLYEFLESRAPWVRPADTGRSTNCLINVAGIHVHRTERGFHNYAEPYSWDVRLGHKTRLEALDELDDDIDLVEVGRILDEIGYEPKRPEILTAWYRTPDGEPLDPALLRSHLRERLPERVIPSAFVHVTDLPLADSAKLDTSSLPAPSRRQGGTGDYAPPETPTEAAVADIWATVLDTARVGRDDDFFDMGGASLAALQAVAAVEDRLDIQLPDAYVFEHRTVREFAAAIDELSDDAAERTPIPLLDTPRPAPLTEGEEAMLFEYQADPSDARYNVTRLYTVEDTVDLARLHEAFRAVVRHHPALYTAFDADRTELPVDAALSFAPFPTDDHRRFAETERGEPFDLEQGPLVRVHADHATDGATDVLVGLHHICIDAGTFDLLWSDVERAYDGEPLPALPATVAAHGEWQRHRVGPSGDFWRDRRASTDDPDPVRLAPPTAPEADGYLRLEAGVSTSELAATGTTPFAVALAAAAICLGDHSRTRHVDLGVTASRKDHPDIAPAVGYFLNTLPLGVDVDPEATIHDVVVEAAQTVADALPHRAYPYARMVNDARGAGQASPDVSLMLAYEQLAPASFGGAHADHEILSSGVSISDLTLFVQERGEAVLLGAEYRGATVGRTEAQRVLDSFHTALAACCRRPHHTLGELFASTAAPDLVAPAPSEQPVVVARIVDHARKSPDMAAVHAHDGDLTYGALLERATAVAAGITDSRPGAKRVGVAVHRTADLLPAIVGVWLAGAAYVPLDPTIATAQRERIAEAAAMDLVVADHDVASWCPAPVLALADVDSAAGATPQLPSPNEQAYVVFTSGSTGVPAGVTVTHANLAASTAARPPVYGPTPPERFLLTSSIGFDSSMVGLFWPLATGGSIVLAADDDVHDIDRLAALVDEHRVSHLLMVPTLYRALLDRHPERLASLQVAIVAGESCPAALVTAHAAALPQTELFNEYGPTEATVWASVHRCQSGDDPVPIGGPIPGGRLRVADAGGRAMAPTASGELWVSGPGVSAGYVSGRDSAAFVEHDDLRWYRTGDLVRRERDELLFLGRIDDQLNVGGVRVEPEELEAAITAIEGVDAAVVTPRTFGDRSSLVAHVVADERVVEPADVRRHMSERHGAAAPRAVVFVESLPRTAHGKLDRRAAAALPLPTAAPDERTDSFVAIWQQAIGDPTLGADDDFFTAGGDSLAAAEIVAAVSDLTGRDVPIGLLLRARTARALAGALEIRLAQEGDPSPIDTIRHGTPDGLVVLGITPSPMTLDREIAADLPPDATVLSVRLDEVGRTVDEVAEELASDLADTNTGRPTLVIGWESAGFVAHELGRRLARIGPGDVRVAMVDTDLPGDRQRESVDTSFGARVRTAPAEGRRLARRYGARLQRAGLALQGKQIPPTAGGVAFTATHRPQPSGVPVLLFTSPTAQEDRPEEEWRRVEPQLDVVELDRRPEAATGFIAASLSTWLRFDD